MRDEFGVLPVPAKRLIMQSVVWNLPGVARESLRKDFEKALSSVQDDVLKRLFLFGLFQKLTSGAQAQVRRFLPECGLRCSRLDLNKVIQNATGSGAVALQL